VPPGILPGVIGLIGSGNMARALARGWGEPVLCSDVLQDRARALAAETGGEAVGSNAELAERADLVLLCHKPAQLAAVAAEVGGRAKAVVSILGATPVAAVREAYAPAPVVRMLPSTPVEVGRGVCCHARDPQGDPALTERVLALFGRVGPVVTVEEPLIDAAMGLMSCAPAYYALVVVGTMAGSAALLEHRDNDTLAVRREVTSPGGSTARGLAALERAGVRDAFAEALDAVLDGRS
jgi:pyrroline-5-carboxylate reductase